MATVSFTTTAAEDARMASAVGITLGLTNTDSTPRAATGPEIKAYWISEMRRLVMERERDAAIKTFSSTTFSPT